jgi:MSHA pilin protein MshA
MSRKANDGFTLIELIIVIAVLGILAAVALPKFADLTTEAQNAAFSGVSGGFNSAIQIVHAKWLATGATASADVSLDNGATVKTTSAGWPTIDTADTAQDTAAKLYALIMTGAVPTGWTSAETPQTNLGLAGYTFTAKADPDTVSYTASTGLVCENNSLAACP